MKWEFVPCVSCNNEYPCSGCAECLLHENNGEWTMSSNENFLLVDTRINR